MAEIYRSKQVRLPAKSVPSNGSILLAGDPPSDQTLQKATDAALQPQIQSTVDSKSIGSGSRNSISPVSPSALALPTPVSPVSFEYL